MTQEQKARRDQIKVAIFNDRHLLQQGIIAIFNRQTQHEQRAEATIEHNDVGFNKSDAPFFSRCASQIQQGKNLEGWDLETARERMPKYCVQLVRIGFDPEGNRRKESSLKKVGPGCYTVLINGEKVGTVSRGRSGEWRHTPPPTGFDQWFPTRKAAVNAIVEQSPPIDRGRLCKKEIRKSPVPPALSACNAQAGRETFTIHGLGFSATCLDCEFVSVVIEVRYRRLKAGVREMLICQHFQIAPDCKWIDERPGDEAEKSSPVPRDSQSHSIILNSRCDFGESPVPAAAPTDDDDLPVGRLIKGDGYQAVIKSVAGGRPEGEYRAFHVVASVPQEDVAADLARRNIAIASDCNWVAKAQRPTFDDERRAHQKKFFGVINGNKGLFAAVGLTPERIHQFYKIAYEVESLNDLPLAALVKVAAEVQCMKSSVTIRQARAKEMRRKLEGFSDAA